MTTVDYESVYRSKCVAYDALVRAEDADGELEGLIRRLSAEANGSVADIGCGTGRVTRWLARADSRVLAGDVSPAMLDHARSVSSAEGWNERTDFFVCDVCDIPLADAVVGLAIAGWVVGHFADFYPQAWLRYARQAVTELRRIVKPDGRVVLVETMGTGVDAATPPTSRHADYYNWLTELGFRHSVLRTDYLFRSMSAGRELVEMFFGRAVADRVGPEAGPRLKEFTGVWRWPR